ncbi:MAG TPA: MFS transporter [Acidimicrobiales bacterium]|nr:MFS transporter [Acidimicrobiales bacterium]
MTALLAPLRSRAFRWLEGTAVFANAGVWMVTLVGGFIMEQLTTSPVLVALAASMTPLAGIFAVVFSGAAADARDRRAVLLVAKLLLASSAAFLAIISAARLLSPATLLVGLAGMGIANGTSSPTWWTTVADLVPPEIAPVALSVDSFQWNIGQVVGPVLGGAVLRGAGSASFFAVCGALMLPLVGFLVIWRGRSDLRLSTPGGDAAESLLGAISSGWRYFANTPGLRAIAARTALYAAPAAALGALLPLFAAHYLHTTALGYGAYLALVGVGAMLAALAVPRLQGHLHLDALVAAATVANGLAVGALVLWPNRWAAVPALLVTGATWVWATMAFVIAARQVTPEWVQTRALSLYYVVLEGPFVVGGLGFGVIDSFLPLRTTLLVSALAFIPGVLVIPRFGLPVVDRASLEIVGSPSLVVNRRIQANDGPVLILVEYRIDEEGVDDFLAAMADLRIVRRHLGGTRWGVFEDVTEHGRFMETFLVASWQGYMLQRAHYTKADTEAEARAFAFHRGPGEPRIERMVHPETVEAAQARSEWRREMMRLITERS